MGNKFSVKDNLLSIILFGMGLICFVLFFVFNPKGFTVSFNSNGGSSVQSEFVKENELATKPVDPTKENARFIAWYLGDNAYDFNSAVTSDITLNAIWKNIYNVSVNLEDNLYTTEVMEGDKLDISTLNLTNRDGYVIKLYKSDNTEYDLQEEVKENLELTGNYLALQKYIVKFDSNGARQVDDIEVWEGSMVSEPKVERNGYILDGWYNQDDKYNFNTPVSENLNLKAKWTEKGKVNVNFEVDGKVIQTVAVKEDTKVVAINNPTKKGYVFNEWQLNGSKYDFNTLVTREITLVANFREAKEYTVTFNYDNGSANKVTKMYEGEKVVRPATPIKTGYQFDTWKLNGRTYDFNTPLTGNITLKATWKVNVFYKITFNSVGGSAVDTQKVEANAIAVKPANPTKQGHVFLEWQLNGKPYGFNTPVTSDITLNATWRVLGQFLVSFDSDGGTSINGQFINEGDTAIMPNITPTKEGYTFIEWQLDGVKYDFNTPVTKAITLKAKWQ